MEDPTGISPSPQTPSKTDLLIRSLTTALSLFSPNSNAQNENKHHLSGRYDQFDRLSLFFVSGAAGDVAAITALTEGNYVTFQTVQAQTDNGQFAVMKNSEPRVDSEQTEQSDASDILSSDALNEPARRCLERGPKSISPQTHGAILEHLLKSMYQAEIPEDRNQRADVLHRYIYSFCTDKILRRFNSKVPGFKPLYVSLLLSPTDSITLEEYRTYSEKEVVLPQRLASRDESRVYAALKALYPRRNVELADKRLILDIENQWTLWTCFKYFLRKAQDCLRDLQALKGKRHKIKEEIESALEHLDGLKQAMVGIFLLTHYSPSFWIVMERMAPLLELRLGPETRGNRTPSASPTRHPESGQDSAEYSPPSSTTQTGPGDHPSSPHSTATVDADSSEVSDDDDATSDVETTRHHHPARKTEQSEDFHDVISKSWSRVTITVRHWMKSITQWHHGIEDLAHGPKKLGILSKSLTIDVKVAPISPFPSQQTSLIDTIKSTSYSSDVERALGILRKKATLSGATEPLLQALRSQELSDEAVSKMWESAFCGGIHCEAQLAYNILQQNPEHKCLIGISKRCCFCCAELLRALKVNDGDIVEHGKIYSWSPPCEASEETKQIVLKKLREKFESYLKGCDRRGHRTPDSGSGNDSNGGLSPPVMDYVITKFKEAE